MNRSPASRLTALLAAVLFFLAWGGEAVGVHPCAHHSAIHRVLDVHAVGTHEHGAHHAAPEHSDAPEHAGCTCISGCTPGAGSLLPPPAAELAAPAALGAVVSRSFPPVQSTAPHHVPYFLPYAQAPPLG